MQDKKRDTDVYRLLDSMGEGEGGMIWENSIETCILSSMKQIASPGWMHGMGAGWCTGMTQGGGIGGGCVGVQDEEHMWTHGWFMSMCGRSHCSVVEWLASN